MSQNGPALDPGSALGDAAAGFRHESGEATMRTIFSPRHAGHGGNLELMAGEILPAFEKPSRAEFVRARIEAVGLGPIDEPDEH